MPAGQHCNLVASVSLFSCTLHAAVHDKAGQQNAAKQLSADVCHAFPKKEAVRKVQVFLQAVYHQPERQLSLYLQNMLVTFQVDPSLIYGASDEPAALVDLRYAAGSESCRLQTAGPQSLRTAVAVWKGKWRLQQHIAAAQHALLLMLVVYIEPLNLNHRTA